MNYDVELQFTNDLLRNFRLEIRYLKENDDIFALDSTEYTMRTLLKQKLNKERVFELLHSYCKPNTIYQVRDFLMCNYLIFQMPDTKDTPVFAFIGPYTTAPVSKQDQFKIADTCHVSPDTLTQLEQFYRDIPLISDESALLVILYTLGTRLWGSLDAFTKETIMENFSVDTEDVTPESETSTSEDALLGMHLLEERYAIESQIMQAIAAGQTHKAELLFESLSSRQFEQRTPNSLRNMKNYLIVMNTVLRIAAHSGAVHPLHVDKISSNFAKKIETITLESSTMPLMKEMIRKYCLLVKNHSLKGYSLLIRKVITNIDSDLTADLSLKTQAELLNVNSSYLSTLFKKEVRMTLTEYVNRKRIEHAIFLLNSTNMQIQTVAQYCGIPDVNYFTKIFKKIVGKTPKEYRESVHAM